MSYPGAWKSSGLREQAACIVAVCIKSTLYFVVADTVHIAPIGVQGVFRVTEHAAHVSGMLFGGVEVSVVADVHGEVHGNINLRTAAANFVPQKFPSPVN